MKHNSKWIMPGYERGEMVYNTRVPLALKTPALGKFVVYNLPVEDWKVDPNQNWSPSIDELNDLVFQQNVHMISSLELSHPKPKFRTDNIKSVKVLWNDAYREIDKGDLRNWFYCPVSKRLDGYHIAITGSGATYPKTTFKHLIMLSGAEYNPKPNERTNLIINCSPVATKALAYAKKHNIKKITETEFFQFFK